MNFRHQVHIGHNDDIETLSQKKSDNQTSNSATGTKQQVNTSSANSTLSSRSLSFKDERDDDSDQPYE